MKTLTPSGLLRDEKGNVSVPPDAKTVPGLLDSTKEQVNQAAAAFFPGLFQPDAESADHESYTPFSSNWSYVAADASFRQSANRKKLVTVELAALAHQMFAEEVIKATMATPFSKFFAKIQSKAEGWITETVAEKLAEEISSWLAAAVGLMVSITKETLIEQKIRDLGAKYRQSILDAHLFSSTDKKPVGRVMERVKFR